MKTTWGIVGLGWLGEALATELRARGHSVWGTHRAQFQVADDPFPETSCDVLFLNTPPLTQIDPDQYASEVSASAKIIFVSSTSVYGNLEGSVSEKTLPQPATASARWLVQVEEALRTRFESRLTVIRPGGLIGGERHPIFHLSGRVGVGSPKHPVNLIHRDDLIGILMATSSESLPVVNAVAPHHPSRDEYYPEWARKMGLPTIGFSEQDKSLGRKVDSDFLAQLYRDWKCPHLDFI